MSETNEIGYGKPPAATRFKKGQSGNPKGRPKGRHNRPPYEALLDQMVTINDDGSERRVTAAEAFLLHLTKRGLDGDGAAARAARAAIEEARAAPLVKVDAIKRIVFRIFRPGSVNYALEPLRMATKLDRYRPSVRILLEPWIVEKALSRLGTRRLSLEEQAVVVQAVRTPHKVKWPSWWKIRP